MPPEFLVIALVPDDARPQIAAALKRGGRCFLDGGAPLREIALEGRALWRQRFVHGPRCGPSEFDNAAVTGR